MVSPVDFEWGGNKLTRVPQVNQFLEKAGKKNGWLEKDNQGGIVELLANHVGGRQKDKCRKAFELFLDGKLEGLQQDNGKALSSAFIFAVMLGRIPSATGTVRSVGNKVDGIYTDKAGFETSNPGLFRRIRGMLVSEGGIFSPQKASTKVTSALKRVTLAQIAEKIREQDEVAARIEEYAMSRRPRPLPVAQESPLKALHATVKETAKQRKARKQRERRAAVKASKSSK